MDFSVYRPKDSYKNNVWGKTVRLTVRIKILIISASGREGVRERGK